MNRICATALAALFAGSSVGLAVESGLPVGERVPAFNVLDVTGPNKGKELCYRCKFGNSPVVTMFTRELSEPIVATIVELDKTLGKNKELKGFVVYMTDDTESATKELEKLAKDHKLKNVPLTIVDSKGPEGYKLAKDAGVTVLMWNESKVVVNQAFEPNSFCEACSAEVIANFAKVEPKKDGATKAN